MRGIFDVKREAVSARRHPRTRHPKSVMYNYPYVNSGFEGALYKVQGRNVIHKFFRQAWILAKYKMFLNGKGIFAKAVKRAQKRFGTNHDPVPVENKAVAHHGIPVAQFKMITFVLSHASEDIISQARKRNIPVPQIARAVKHPQKDLYILELSDLSKEGHSIVSGNQFVSLHSQKVKNADEIISGMKQDIKKLEELGYEEDNETHPPYSAWLIRINKKTKKAERFLWDPTNLRIK